MHAPYCEYLCFWEMEHLNWRIHQNQWTEKYCGVASAESSTGRPLSLQIKENSVSNLGWEEKKKSIVVVEELVCCLRRDYANLKEYA